MEGQRKSDFAGWPTAACRWEFQISTTLTIWPIEHTFGGHDQTEHDWDLFDAFCSVPSVRCQHRFADRNRSHTFVFASAIASRSAAADGHSIDNLRRLASAERLISGCFSVCFTFHRDTEAAKPKPRGAQKSAGDLFTPATPKSGSKSG